MLRNEGTTRIGKRVLAAAFLLPLLAAVMVLAIGDSDDAEAATFTVTKTSDSFDNQCDADCSLREAVVEANQTTGADVIVLSPGTYTLSIPQCDDPCSTFEEETTGDLDIRDNLTIQGSSARNTAIDSSNIDDPGDLGSPIEFFTDRQIDTIGAGALTIRIESVTLQGGVEGPSGVGSAADDGNGAAIRNRTGSSLTLFNVTIENNATTVDGGAIYNTGELDLEKVTINGNGAEDDGGGVYNGGAGEVSMINTTISENSAPAASGGNIYNADAGATISLLNVTIAMATAGDGITEAAGTVTAKNSLIVENDAADCTNPISTNGQNTDSDGTCGLSPSKGDNTDTNPGIGPLQNNGGQTDTHALALGSSPVDSADNGACPADDQRNIPRPIDGDNNAGAVCDRGAYELAECRGSVADIVGTEGDDVIDASDGVDNNPNVILGLGGNDTIFGLGGADKICGGLGADIMIGGTGDDEIDGGGGSDTADFRDAAGVRADLQGGFANDTTTGNDDLFSIENATGGAGPDKLLGDGGPNLLIGGGDKDVFQGRAGGDILLGESGNDTFYPGPGDDDIQGGDGDDNLRFISGPVRVDVRSGNATGEGNDSFSSIFRFYGTTGNDEFIGDDQANKFAGRNGDDIFDGNGGNDRITGGLGKDTVDYSGNVAVTVDLNNHVATGVGTDTLLQIDNVIGSSKADSITGSNNGNVLRGGSGDDAISGLRRGDDLFGEGGDDDLDGGNGADDCNGGTGTDTAVRCETEVEIP